MFVFISGNWTIASSERYWIGKQTIGDAQRGYDGRSGSTTLIDKLMNHLEAEVPFTVTL
ncbi:hypothetical protein [Paenibacillus favisporus]|uniref:hypothetical protein n=1 Tax=Paenibacillus favisporus TaxID=221028 RepID=UPI0013D7DAAF|nr:hypothetical protein [Paenibacillus favisporus]